MTVLHLVLASVLTTFFTRRSGKPFKTAVEALISEKFPENVNAIAAGVVEIPHTQSVNQPLHRGGIESNQTTSTTSSINNIQIATINNTNTTETSNSSSGVSSMTSNQFHQQFLNSAGHGPSVEMVESGGGVIPGGGIIPHIGGGRTSRTNNHGGNHGYGGVNQGFTGGTRPPPFGQINQGFSDSFDEGSPFRPYSRDGW